MKDFSELMVFLEQMTGLSAEEWIPAPRTPWQLAEALWPMWDTFRPRAQRLKVLPYLRRHEQAADEAIIDFAVSGQEWTDALPAGVWRVLLERHMQMLTVCMLNEGVIGGFTWHLPAQLPAEYETRAAVLEWWLRMKLPFPPHAKGSMEFPDGSVPGPMRLH